MTLSLCSRTRSILCHRGTWCICCRQTTGCCCRCCYCCRVTTVGKGAPCCEERFVGRLRHHGKAWYEIQLPSEERGYEIPLGGCRYEIRIAGRYEIQPCRYEIRPRRYEIRPCRYEIRTDGTSPLQKQVNIIPEIVHIIIFKHHCCRFHFLSFMF